MQISFMESAKVMPPTVHKTIVNGKHLYINLKGFKDEKEQEMYYSRIKQLIKEATTRVNVY